MEIDNTALKEQNRLKTIEIIDAVLPFYEILQNEFKKSKLNVTTSHSFVLTERCMPYGMMINVKGNISKKHSFTMYFELYDPWFKDSHLKLYTITGTSTTIGYRAKFKKNKIWRQKDSKTYKRINRNI